MYNRNSSTISAHIHLILLSDVPYYIDESVSRNELKSNADDAF